MTNGKVLEMASKKIQHIKRPLKRGRPVVYLMPDPIQDTPDNIAQSVLNSPTTPPGGWQFLKDHKAAQKRRTKKG